MDVDELKNDNMSGALEICVKAAGILQYEIERIDIATGKRLQSRLLDLGIKIIISQPRMAPLYNLVNEVLLACEKSGDPEMFRKSAKGLVDDFLIRLSASEKAIIRQCENLIRSPARIATYSRSSTVVKTLLALFDSGVLAEVLLCESRPMLEGKRAAAELAASGVPVSFFVDAAMDEMVARCDLVLVGADSFSEEKLINKIGTKALTLVARQRQKPVYALATMPKFLPSSIAMPAEPEHGQNEVWANPPLNVRVVNHYFEQVAVDCFDGIITEEGIFDKRDLEKIVGGKSYHSALVSKLAELGKQSQGNPGIF